MQDMNKEEVERVMKKVDNRNLRRISRMLLEADVKAAEEQEKLKDISMQKVLKSVETRNIRKISKSLQVRCYLLTVSMSVTDLSFSHPQQGRINFNTVNPSLPTGMDFLIHPCR